MYFTGCRKEVIYSSERIWCAEEAAKAKSIASAQHKTRQETGVDRIVRVRVHSHTATQRTAYIYT